MLTNKRKFDDLLEEHIETAVVSAASIQQAALVNGFKSRPLIRWYVTALVKQELRAAGLWGPRVEVDWDKIGDFLVKIAPIIFQLIDMFL